jgi:hypothetical protein
MTRPGSVVPLLQWLEQNKIVPKGTVKQVNDLADNVKTLGDALKAGGLTK